MFICIECDQNLLTRSAIPGAHRGGNRDPDGGGGGGGVNAELRNARRRRRTFATVAAFLARRPAYNREWFDDGLRRIEGVRQRAAIKVDGDERRTDLLMAAIALAMLLEIPHSQISPEIRSLVPMLAGESYA
ncbi:hypothetical protein GCM10023087_22150 [Microbacterium rhizosphaerae]